MNKLESLVADTENNMAAIKLEISIAGLVQMIETYVQTVVIGFQGHPPQRNQIHLGLTSANIGNNMMASKTGSRPEAVAAQLL
jgi:hypothetical protein